MKRARGFTSLYVAILAVAMASLPLACPAQSQDIDPEAMQLLRRSLEFLERQKQFRVDTDTTIEAVLTTGQKLQFGGHVLVTVRRPDRMHAERVGELVKQAFYYDGKSLSVHLPDEKAYATVAAPPTIDGMLDMARDELGVIAPGADLIYSNAYERLTEGLTSAFVVGKAVIGGVRCDQIAFRNAQVDWQLWIEEGQNPLPRKFIVTSKNMTQSPQFTVLLTKWEAAPAITDESFRFVPPPGAQRIEFLPVNAAAPKAK